MCRTITLLTPPAERLHSDVFISAPNTKGGGILIISVSIKTPAASYISTLNVPSRAVRTKEILFAGCIAWDHTVLAASRARESFVLSYPKGKATEQIDVVAERVFQDEMDEEVSEDLSLLQRLRGAFKFFGNTYDEDDDLYEDAEDSDENERERPRREDDDERPRRREKESSDDAA